jgi:hypothetical protein
MSARLRLPAWSNATSEIDMGTPLSFDEMLFRATCLGAVGMLVVPMATFIISRPILLSMGVCEIPVFCDIHAGDIAAVAALPGAVVGAGLSLFLDRGKVKA